MPASVDMVSLLFVSVNNVRDHRGRILIAFTHHQAFSQVVDNRFGLTESKLRRGH